MGWLCASGLGAELGSQTRQLCEHQGRQSPRLIWLRHSATELVVTSVFAVWGCPPTIYSGSGTFEYRFIHRWFGGGFKQTVSAPAGARKRSRPSRSLPGSRQCQYLPLTSQLSSLPARGPSAGRPLRAAAYLRVIGPAFVSFWLVRCKGLGTGIGCKPAHSGDRQGRKIRCLVWLPQWSAVLVFMACPSRGAVRLKR